MEIPPPPKKKNPGSSKRFQREICANGMERSLIAMQVGRNGHRSGPSVIFSQSGWGRGGSSWRILIEDVDSWRPAVDQYSARGGRHSKRIWMTNSTTDPPTTNPDWVSLNFSFKHTMAISNLWLDFRAPAHFQKNMAVITRIFWSWIKIKRKTK